jgi:hypothetical protein
VDESLIAAARTHLGLQRCDANLGLCHPGLQLGQRATERDGPHA